MDFSGKVVLITGSSRGIGAAVAEAFGSRGAQVIVNYIRNKAAAEAVAERIRGQGGEAVALQADVTDPQAVQAMVSEAEEAFGRLDVVVNNALSPYSFDPKRRKTAWEIGWNDYQEQLEGSLGGAFHVCRAAIPLMKEGGGGRIVNLVTNLIDFPVVPYHDYTTAKAALLGYSRNLAAELGAFGITVNCVAPGLTSPTDSSRETKEDTKNAIIGLTPLGRLASPKDIAGAVLFFASDWAAFVTGQCLNVDGGLVMR
ncbi:3-oxoacyl-[acyl-carrier protein] reductase [Paenibacillus sp. UNCCL117]|uniref:3-oxoacyl-ACP reductase n=1 Tax=unclassified Paenibacillus TaxID=185978 RepID=UPI0008918790|nr:MULTISPECIES: 3-oxoacyl-ACP reductase [unclassified Paenibacillus]SDD02120.1 3-oxoacyl-[acyl-carrier protein] reductase [Paenibacillus sp. cl123]SFW32547.1 3-oxoacyl-[acyl-carrier protein] reductase [Paenibacillus sp. UNCCL117]